MVCRIWPSRTDKFHWFVIDATYFPEAWPSSYRGAVTAHTGWCDSLCSSPYVSITELSFPFDNSDEVASLSPNHTPRLVGLNSPNIRRRFATFCVTMGVPPLLRSFSRTNFAKLQKFYRQSDLSAVMHRHRLPTGDGAYSGSFRPIPRAVWAPL